MSYFKRNGWRKLADIDKRQTQHKPISKLEFKFLNN